VITIDLWEQLTKRELDKKFTLVTYPQIGEPTYAVFNQKLDPALRQALAATLDRQSYNDAFGASWGAENTCTFALPNLQGSAPMHQGQGSGLSERFLGEMGGSQFVTLLESEMPAHTHTLNGSSRPAIDNDPGDAYWGATAGLYSPTASPARCEPSRRSAGRRSRRCRPRPSAASSGSRPRAGTSGSIRSPSPTVR
jgi:hypothetical protein